jgi:hypothetical protein
MNYAFETNTADFVEHKGSSTGNFYLTLSLTDNSTCFPSDQDGINNTNGTSGVSI